MDDSGRYEHIVERLRRSRERRDGSQLLDGLRAFRLDTWYGGNVIARAASDAGFSRSALYEYRVVWAFYWQTYEGEQYSAWRNIRLFPHLTYAHLRDAIELEDLGDVLAAFEAAAVGDQEFTLRILLQKVKDEADRLIAAGSGLDRERAYQRAIASVVMLAAEEQAVTPFEARLLERLDQAVRRNGGRPVSTKSLMAELSIDTWSIWYHLRRLEERGLVHRPEGPKSGWAVAA